MAGHCFCLRNSLSLCLSVCLSLAQRKTDIQNQMEHPAPVSSGFYMRSLQPTVRLEFSPRVESSGRKWKTERTRGAKATQLPCPQLGSLLPRAPSTTESITQLQRQPDPKGGLSPRAVSGRHSFKVSESNHLAFFVFQRIEKKKILEMVVSLKTHV